MQQHELGVIFAVVAAQMAMQRVQMCNAIKVMCVFSKPFWPQDFFDIICTGSLL